MPQHVLSLSLAKAENDADESYFALEISIDGESLRSRVQQFEANFPECLESPGLAGAYSFVPLQYWPTIQVRAQAANKIMLLQCACGEPGCWPLIAEILLSGDHVVWQNFRQPHRASGSKQPVWDYSGFGPFYFDLNSYRQQLQLIASQERDLRRFGG